MNLQFYLEKLFASEKFQSFVKENPSAYFCSGFISIDKEKGDNKIHIDYIIPETKKIFSFQLEGEVDMIPVEQSGEGLEPIGTQGCTPKNIPKNIFTKGNNLDFDFEEIEKMIEDKIKEQEIKNKIQKILLSLQKVKGKTILVGTIFISGLGMIKIKINLEEKRIVEFEKKSFFDMFNILRKSDVGV